VGLVAAAIPPIIHLILRRRAVLVRFSALEFILRSNRKTARRFRIKQVALMVLRSALLALLALAVARPILDEDDSATLVSSASAGATVVVVDAGFAMGYVLGDETLLDRARNQARELLRGGPSKVALVVASDAVDVPVSEATSDVVRVRKAIDEIELGHRADRLPEAVARAYEILGDEPATLPRRVVVFTTAAGATGPLPPPPPASGLPVELMPVDVSGGAETPNRAVVDVALRPAPEMGAGQWRIDARVANYGSERVERLRVSVVVEDTTRLTGFVTLQPGAEAIKSFYLPVEGAAAVPARVQIESDALGTDDRRAFWLHPVSRIRVLAVNGDPQPTPYRDELFYLERALAPSATAGARVLLTIAGIDVLERHDFDQFDVVVLANVREISEARARALSAFVRAGGGLLVSVGDQVVPATTNQRLGALLPRTLRAVRQAGDAAASTESGDRRSARLGQLDFQHPLFGGFAAGRMASMSKVRVRRYMLLDPSPEAGGEVPIFLDNGAPYLLTRSLDQGRVALLTSTLDRDWGDLPIRPDFVPLLQRLLRYLTRITEVNMAPVLLGRPAKIEISDRRIGRVQVRTPGGALRLSERPGAPDATWTFAATDVPGHYEVAADPPLPGVTPPPGFAVAVDPGGSDLRPVTARQVPGHAAEKPTAAAVGITRRTELWHAALALLFIMLLGEGLLLFKRRREDPHLPRQRGTDAAAG
jgi:hypothetical protein